LFLLQINFIGVSNIHVSFSPAAEQLQHGPAEGVHPWIGPKGIVADFGVDQFGWRNASRDEPPPMKSVCKIFEIFI
jgi:hypothetical protein